MTPQAHEHHAPPRGRTTNETSGLRHDVERSSVTLFLRKRVQVFCRCSPGSLYGSPSSLAHPFRRPVALTQIPRVSLGVAGV
jgi:hypothetical protein